MSTGFFFNKKTFARTCSTGINVLYALRRLPISIRYFHVILSIITGGQFYGGFLMKRHLQQPVRPVLTYCMYRNDYKHRSSLLHYFHVIL